jgi:MFS family permease
MQVLGGGLADRFGGGRVLTGAVFAWSAATVLTPYAASVGLPSLLAMRIAMVRACHYSLKDSRALEDSIQNCLAADSSGILAGSRRRSRISCHTLDDFTGCSG